jgi:hypothetical protein
MLILVPAGLLAPQFEIVDANDQTVYNCLIPYNDNAEYRADDWLIPIDSARVEP